MIFCLAGSKFGSCYLSEIYNLEHTLLLALINNANFTRVLRRYRTVINPKLVITSRAAMDYCLYGLELNSE